MLSSGFVSRFKRILAVNMLQHGLPTTSTQLKRRMAIRLAHKVNVGRLACVGQEVVNLKNAGGETLPMVTVPKARTDLLLDIMKGKNGGLDSREVWRFVKEEPVYWVTLELQHLASMIHRKEVSCLFMDSFSDLTDQRFTHREGGWSFCSHYEGLDHSDDFNQTFSCDGLLDIEAIWSVYDEFFHAVRGEYPDIQIVYIHFSCKFETREKFKQRTAALDDVMLEMQEKYNIVNIRPAECDVFKSEVDNYPYHYTQETFHRYVNAWGKAIKEREKERV